MNGPLPDLYRQIAWYSTALCVAFSGRIAFAFLKKSSRFFTVMALFTCVWALLLPFYGDVAASDLFSAYGGFLLIYIGGLLSLEARQKKERGKEKQEQEQEEDTSNEVTTLQGVGLKLFLLIAAPSAIAMHAPSGVIFGLKPGQTELAVATILDVLGYVSLAGGVQRLFDKKVSYLIAPLVIIYSVSEIKYTFDYWPHPNDPMTPLYYSIFSIEKLCLTSVFGCLIAHYAMPQEDRKKGWTHWLEKFVGTK